MLGRLTRPTRITVQMMYFYRVGLQVWQLGFADNTHITCGHGSGGILTRAKSNDDSNPTIMVSIDNAANANHVTL